MARSQDADASQNDHANEIDVRAIGSALNRRRRTYLVPTALAFALIALYVTIATPRYTAQTQILLENQETFFTRPDRISLPSETAAQLDEAAVASQVQLINSPDIARRAIRQLKLAGNDEFDPYARTNPITRALMLVGLVSDPTRENAESRMVETFGQKLTAYSPPKTRVLTIEFTSRDATLAARAANTVAELYIQEQSAAKRAQAQAAAEALSAQIGELRVKLAKADHEREQYRTSSNLLAGSNNMTIGGQQLADINSDLSRARSLQADAQAKSSMIRELLRAGKAADVAEVTNNDIVRRIWDQRSVAQAQLALESRTLLPGHPRIKELTAQVAQYEAALKSAAKQAASTLENEASIAGQRVANLEAVLSQQKKAVGVSNGDEVHLRALERIAQSFKDQLESSTTKYEEAAARQSSTATPADARIISRAVPPRQPSYPKKVPFIVFGTVATFIFAAGFVVASELMADRSVVASEPGSHSKSTDTAEAAVVATQFETTPSVELPEQVVPEKASNLPFARTGLPSFRRNLLKAFSPAVDDDALVFAPAKDTPSRGFLRRSSEAAATGTVLSAALAYLGKFGRSAEQSEPLAAPARAEADLQPSGIGWDIAEPQVPAAAQTAIDPVVQPQDNLPSIVERVVASHVPGRGLHLVGTSIGGDATSTDRLIALARSLAEKGRSLIVDLGTTPVKLAVLSDAIEGRAKIMTLAGLSELLAGNASFAEVIHRDYASRLHFIPTGLHDADFRDFDLILDALSETYDFIVLLTPAFPQSEIAKVMAPYADFVVLAATIESDREELRVLEAEMIEAGARDVVVVERTAPLAQQVA